MIQMRALRFPSSLDGSGRQSYPASLLRNWGSLAPGKLQGFRPARVAGQFWGNDAAGAIYCRGGSVRCRTRPGFAAFQVGRSHPQGGGAEAERSERLDGGRLQNPSPSAGWGSSSLADMDAFCSAPSSGLCVSITGVAMTAMLAQTG